MSLTDTIDANIRGFAHKRSRTWPFVVERLSATVWVVADEPRKGERVREYFGVHTDSTMAAAVRKHAAGRAFLLCVAHSALRRDLELEAAYTAAGLRLHGREGLFVRRMPPRPRRLDAHDIRRVDSVDAARALAKAARGRQLTEDEAVAVDADMRVYIAVVDGRPVGWAGSVRTAPDTACAVDVFVERNHRRQGIGQALMRQMLIDDAKRSITANHLTASRAGARLYASVGYELLGTLTVFRG